MKIKIKILKHRSEYDHWLYEKYARGFILFQKIMFVTKSTKPTETMEKDL